MTSKLRHRGTGTVIRRSKSELMTVAEWKANKQKSDPVKYGDTLKNFGTTPENPRQKTQQQKVNENG